MCVVVLFTLLQCLYLNRNMSIKNEISEPALTLTASLMFSSRTTHHNGVCLRVCVHFSGEY